MTILTITTKGQVTFRQDLLQHLGVGPGQKIEIDKLPDGRILVRAAEQNGKISDFIGCLSQNVGQALTIDEMNAVAAQGWARKK